jgi:hypothetical protein
MGDFESIQALLAADKPADQQARDEAEKVEPPHGVTTNDEQ